MAWEERNGNRYYYRKRREGSRVVSEYIGAGDLAEGLLFLDEIDRDHRELERQAEREEREAQQAIDKQIDEVIGLARLLADAAMIEAGYHRHKGQWRKRRERHTDNR